MRKLHTRDRVHRTARSFHYLAAASVVLGAAGSGRAVIQTYSAATGAGGVGADHPGGPFFQFDPGDWDTGLEAGTTTPPNGQFAFSGSVDAFHMEVRAIQDVGFTGQAGDHAAYFQMNFIGPPTGANPFWFGGVGNDLGPWPKSGGLPVAPGAMLVYADVIVRAGTPMEIRTESEFIAVPGNGFEMPFTGTGTWQSVGGPLNLAGTFGNFDEDDPQIAALIAFGSNGNPELGIDNGSDPLNIPDVFVDNLTMTIGVATWSTDSSGTWSDNSKWDPIAPDGGNARAIFGGAITAPQTVTVDGERFAGTLVFDSAIPYTLDGTGPLNLRAINTAIHTGNTAAINVVTGSHRISAPVVLWGDTTITVTPAASTFTLAGPLVTFPGTTISKDGAGLAQAENIRAARLNVLAGTMRVSQKLTANDPAGTSVVNALAIAAGSRVDLTNNSMVIDYTGPVGTLIDDTREHLENGRLGTSAGTAATRLGYGDNAVVGATTFAGQTVDTDSVLIKFTYAGDADLNGQVDVADLGKLASSWQTNGPWTSGDFDYSGLVDVADLGLLASNWQAGVGSPLGPSLAEALAAVGLSAAAVPEPLAAVGVGVLVLASGSQRPRRRNARS
jgi:hypothetical protein